MSWRALTPLGWAVAAAMVLAALLALATLAGFRFDPFDLSRRRAEQAQIAAAAARAAARARTLEVEGERVQAERRETAARQIESARAGVRALETEARRADDAREPLDPDRLARLRAHDRELCRQYALGGCPAAPDAS